MAKKNGPRHVRVYEQIVRTDAWRSLSGIAAKAWLEIGLMENGSNNGQIAVSARLLGEHIGSCKTTASMAIRELENAGFLVREKSSSFSQKKLAAEYRLTHVPCTVTGRPPTHDYRREMSISEAADICGLRPCDIRDATERGAITFRDADDKRMCNRESVLAYRRHTKEATK
jgi:hypothetical protein